MNRFDPVSALFSGISSVWGRLMLFFATGITAHSVGVSAAYGKIFPELVILAPLYWLGNILMNFLDPICLLYIVFLAIVFILIVFKDCDLPHIVFPYFLVQLWDSFLLQDSRNGPGVAGIIILFSANVLTIGAYVTVLVLIRRGLRQLEQQKSERLAIRLQKAVVGRSPATAGEPSQLAEETRCA